jgi:hypothetical protein
VNTENIVKNLRVLWRTDRIIADIRMRHMLVGLGVRAFAALIAAFGLLMLEPIGRFRAGPDLERDHSGRGTRRAQLRACRHPVHDRGETAIGART